MKFIKFWWKHSLRDGLLVTLFIVTPIWLSGFIHWYIYPRWGGENHVNTSILTIIAWMGIVFVVFVVGTILTTVIKYFAGLIRAYKDAQP